MCEIAYILQLGMVKFRLNYFLLSLSFVNYSFVVYFLIRVMVICEMRKCERVFCETTCETLCDWSIGRRVFRRLPVVAVGSHACSYSFITRSE